MTDIKNTDVVVAGAGLGGLFAAAKLAKEGKKVLLLEKHNIPGGYASTFKRKGYTFESSLHALDGFFAPNSDRIELFEEFGLISKLNFFPLPELYALESNNLDVTIPASYDEAYANLLEKFPEEKEGIDTYFSTVKKVYKQTMFFINLGWIKFLILPVLLILCKDLIAGLRKSVGSFLDSITDNEDLKITLAANTHYYHDNPYNYGLLHYCVGQGSYFHGGAAFLTNGSYAISAAMAKFITDHGGTIRYSSEVTNIAVENNKVQSVSYKNLKTGERETISTKAVVANLPFPVLVNTLPKEVKTSFNSKFKHFTKSNSLFSVYFGLKKPLKELGSDKYTLLMLPKEFNKLKQMFTINETKDYGERIIDLTDYSLLDEYRVEGKPICTAVVIDTIDHWKDLSQDEYKELKEKHTQEIITKLEERYPGFRENIAYYESATPKTFERYTSNPGGAIYGFSQDTKQVGPQRPQCNTAIDGLFLASAWTAPGGGMAPVSKAGYKAALAALKMLS